MALPYRYSVSSRYPVQKPSTAHPVFLIRCWLSPIHSRGKWHFPVIPSYWGGNLPWRRPGWSNNCPGEQPLSHKRRVPSTSPLWQREPPASKCLPAFTDKTKQNCASCARAKTEALLGSCVTQVACAKKKNGTLCSVLFFCPWLKYNGTEAFSGFYMS